MLIAVLMLAGVALARAPTVARAAVAGARVRPHRPRPGRDGASSCPFMILPILLDGARPRPAPAARPARRSPARSPARSSPRGRSANLTRFDEPVLDLDQRRHHAARGQLPASRTTAALIGSWSLRCVVDQTPEGLADPSVEAKEQRRLAFDYIRDHLGRLPKVVVAREGRTLRLLAAGPDGLRQPGRGPAEVGVVGGSGDLLGAHPRGDRRCGHPAATPGHARPVRRRAGHGRARLRRSSTASRGSGSPSTWRSRCSRRWRSPRCSTRRTRRSER